MFWIEAEGDLILAVKAHPGARRVKIGPVIAAAAMPGWPEARLKISVCDPPEDGRANAAILRALAEWLGVKAAAVSQEAGVSARDKKFRVEGVCVSEVQRKVAEF